MAGNGQLQRQGRGHLALSSLPLSPQPPALPSPGQQIPAAADCATKPPSKPLQLEPLPVGSTANSIGGADNAERKAAAAATAVLVLVSAAVVRHSASEKRLVAAVEQHHPMEGEDCLGGEDPEGPQRRAVLSIRAPWAPRASCGRSSCRMASAICRLMGDGEEAGSRRRVLAQLTSQLCLKPRALPTVYSCTYHRISDPGLFPNFFFS